MKHPKAQYGYDYVDVYQPGAWHVPNDTEPAFVALPGHECCPSYPAEQYYIGQNPPVTQSECYCVTSADINLWNQISSLSGIDISQLSSLEPGKWNSTYKTVVQNSGIWMKSSEIDELEDLSSVWQNASKTVQNNSATWNRASSYSGIEINRQNIEQLSADFTKNIKIYFSPDSITGTGAINQPYGVKNYEAIINTLNVINDGYDKLFPNGTQGWVSLTADSDVDGINPYQKALFSAVAVKDTDQDKALIKHSELIEWLIRNLGKAQTQINNNSEWIAENGVIWQNISGVTSQAIASRYRKPKTIYYSFD